MKRRIFAGFLALVMVLGMMPAQIFATETEDYTEPVIVETEAVVETTAPAETEAIVVTTAPEDPEPSEPEQPGTETTAATEEVTEATTEATEEATEETMPEDVPTVIDRYGDDDEEVTPAEPAVVYITGANAGVLVKASDGEPMVNREVTVKDLNKDGVLTYDEALIAAHDTYCANGYATTQTTNGTSVTKLWGVDAGYNYYFFNNKVALAKNVGDTKQSTVKAEDKLYATILKDTEDCTDFFTYFDVEEKTVQAGEEFTLTLNGFQGMSTAPETQAITGAKVGTWNDGKFTALEGKTTDENGQVKLSFATAGTYYVTAEGSVPTISWLGNEVQGPTMPPVCVVTVEGSTTDPSEPEQPAEPAKHYLSGLEFGPSNKTLNVFTLEEGKWDYDFTYPNSDSYSPKIKATLSEDAPEGSTITAWALNYSGVESSYELTSGEEKYASYVGGGKMKSEWLKLVVGVEGDTQTYMLNISRTLTVEVSKLTDSNGGNVIYYDDTYLLDESQTRIKFWIDSNGATAKYVGEEEVTGYAYADIVWDEKDTCQVTVKATYEDQTAQKVLTFKKYQDTMTFQGSCGENVNWKLENGVLTISGTGAMADYSTSNYAPWYTFRAMITSAVVEEGVTSVGDYAFYCCTKIASVTFPKESLTTLGNFSFRETAITEVEVPATVTKLGYNAFFKCERLTTATVYDVMSSGMFSGCSQLSTVNFKGTKLEEIPSSAFCNCGSLKTLVLPEGVKSFGVQVYNSSDHVYFESITIPNTLTGISAAKFGDYLTNITVKEDNPNYVKEGKILYTKDGKELVLAEKDFEGSVTVKEGVTTIGEHAFKLVSGLTSITMPNTVETIGNAAFYQCSNLTDVTLGTGVKSIGKECFYKCAKLKAITLPDTLETVGEAFLCGCSTIERVEIPGKVTKFPPRILASMTSLKEVVLPAGLVSMEYNVFYGYTGSSIYFRGDVDAWNAITGAGKPADGTYEIVYNYGRTDVATIATQPMDRLLVFGDSSSVSVTINKPEGVTVDFAWYVSATKSTSAGTAVTEGVTLSDDGLTSTISPSTAEIGTKYYYCIITTTLADGTTVKGATRPAQVDVSEKMWDGEGSEADPFLLKSTEDLKKLSDFVNAGNSCSGKYFKVTTNITLPTNWKPIGCTVDGSNYVNADKAPDNLHAFSGTIDGKIDDSTNATITVPAGEKPLIGFVLNAYIRNLNIMGEQIEGAGLVNNYTGVGYSGNAVTIENVRVLSGTKTLKSGLVASVGGNGFAHASASFVVTIRNCVVEEGVTIGYTGEELGIGSFAGDINGSVENCVSYATVTGRRCTGGIIAGRDNAMSQCVVKNSQFHGTVTGTEYVGGIVAAGYGNATAPNGACPTITGCTVTGTVKGTERVGGIFGGDGYVAQTWNNVVGSISDNTFTGKIEGDKYVGAIIGYRNSLNRYDTVSGNTYSADCGASVGIGYVKYLDTNCEDPATFEGTVVFNTANGTADCPAVEGCGWQANHNRTDDPLGKDADKLCKMLEAEPLGVVFTSGDQEFTLNFEDGTAEYTVTLEDMANAKLTVKGTKSADTVTLDGEAIPEGGKEYTLSTTATTILLKINDTSYTLYVTNKVNYRLSSLELYTTQAAYQAGDAPLEITPSFDSNTFTGYSAAAPDYLTYLYMVGQLTTPEEKVIAAVSNNWGGWTGCWTQYAGIFKSSVYYTSKGYAGVYLNNNRDEEYQITINPYATLKSLTLDGVMDKNFDRDITSYHAYVDDTAEGVKITATGYKSTYTITVNGKEVTAGESYTLPYVWDENGKMAVEIQVSGSKVSTSTYTFQLEKTPVGDKPFVLKESAEADYTIIDKASYVKDLFVIASADGELSYQWFYNTTASTEGATLIEGATESTYTPPITEVGARYYYCRITNAGAETGNVTYSTPTRVTVDPDPTPIATIVNPGQELTDDNWNVGYRYKVGEQATGLEVTASSAAEGKLTYQWRKYTEGYNILGYSTAAGDATSSVYYPATDISQTNDTGFYYFCEVTNTFKGRTYTAKATTGAKYTDPNTETTYDVNGVYVLIQVDNAAVPEFATQPVGAKYMVGDSMTRLSTRATIADGGTLTYQWYVNDTPDTEGATAIAKATSTSYSLGTATEVGTHYYFCVATNTIQGYSSSTTSDIVEIKIRTAQSIIGDSFVGSGTEEDPFQIATPEDYKSVAAIVADSFNFQGYYFKQTADITLPENWEGIGCLIDPSLEHINAGKNMAAFSGTLDGGGHTITIPEGGLPLFGYVKGATVKNLNIFGKKIAGYGLVNHLEGVSLSGNAITIDNVTLKSGSATEKAGFIGTYITNNGFAGCSAAYTVTIRNSTIEKDVVIGYNADQEMIGSFAGRVHGTIENCVSYATVKGTDYVGGILGTRDNAMGTCSVTNCQFYGTVEASGAHAGGIVGGGYCNSTAPNGDVPSIMNCTVNATISGKDKVGGILGGDTYVAQSWGLWKLTGNTFSGTLTATEGNYVGGIVGYLLSMNKYSDISDNYYTPGSAERAIGYVKYLDTSFENPTTFDGTEVFDTSKGTDACPTVSGCGWRADHNRTDDPLNEETTVTGQATAIASISGKTQLLAGASTTLKALDENGKAITTATWTLAEDAEDYVTLTVKSGVATVKAKDISEGHEVTLTAHADGGADRKVTLTLIPKAQAITLSGDATVTVDIGVENYTVPTLKATVLPADATQSVTWTSSNKKVATVTDGKLTLTGTLGTAKITATTTDGSKLSASVTVNVVKLAQSIRLSGDDSIIGGKTATYTAAEEDGTAIKATNITWSLDDTTYASVNTSGKVTTKAVPVKTEVNLTATIKGSERYATKTITIVPAATYVDILKEETVVTGQTLKRNVNAGETALNLTAAAYPADADQNVKWTTSNAKIATVDENGTVTYAGKPGTVTITATTTDGSNKKATVKITFAALSTKVEIAEHEDTLRSGSKLTLSASTDLAKVGVNWSLANAADKNYVTLSGSKLTAKTVYEEHTVTLIATAKDGGAAATTTVTIQPKDNNVLILKHGDVNVTKTTQSVNRSEGTYTLTAANVAGETQNVTWKTSNKKIVSLSATEGENVTLSLLKAGTATITATAADGSKTTVTIKVTTLVESLSITGSETVASGKAITLKAVATPSTAANKSVTWTLKEGSAYATISSAGKLTANKNLMSAKTVTVQATAKDGSGVTAEKTVTIQPVATSVVMQQKAQTVDMQQEDTFQLSAKVYPDTANQAINWTSSSTRIATVDSKGEVTFHKGGTVTITATAADGSGKKASVKLTVVKGVESLELDDNFLAGGKSLNLAKLLEVGPSDATNKKVVWSMSGDTAYATLSSAGVLKAKTVTQMKTVTVTATAADSYGTKATATIEIYPATTKVVIQADGETVTGTVKLPEGDSLQLNAISLPLDAYQDWTWTSSKNAWAEVDETGCVTGLTAGKTVTITATAKDGTNKKATLKIKIVNN